MSHVPRVSAVSLSSWGLLLAGLLVLPAGCGGEEGVTFQDPSIRPPKDAATPIGVSEDFDDTVVE